MESKNETNPEDKINLVLALAKTLHESGIPSHHLEGKLERFCGNLQLKADFFVSIGSIFASIKSGNNTQTHLIKIKNSDLNLNKIQLLDQLISKVSKKQMPVSEALYEIKQVETQKELHPSWMQIIFFAISTGSAACVFGGKIPEILASFSIGLAIGFLFYLLPYIPKIAKIVVILAAVFSVIIATVFQHYFSDFNKEIATICGLIILIPGFSFTVSITEMVNNHFISGISRFAAAFITFAMLAIGIIVGTKFMENFSLPSNQNAINTYPYWIKFVALLFVPLGFVVLFKARFKDFIWIAIACWVSYFSYSFFISKFEAPIAVFLSAFVLGLSSNLFAKISNKNDSLFLIPGMILLVPGSLGFFSISNLIQSNITEGIETSLMMLTTSLALVFGILLSNLFFDSNK